MRPVVRVALADVRAGDGDLAMRVDQGRRDVILRGEPLDQPAERLDLDLRVGRVGGRAVQLDTVGRRVRILRLRRPCAVRLLAAGVPGLIAPDIQELDDPPVLPDQEVRADIRAAVQKVRLAGERSIRLAVVRGVDDARRDRAGARAIAVADREVRGLVIAGRVDRERHSVSGALLRPKQFGCAPAAKKGVDFSKPSYSICQAPRAVNGLTKTTPARSLRHTTNVPYENEPKGSLDIRRTEY